MEGRERMIETEVEQELAMDTETALERSIETGKGLASAFQTRETGVRRLIG